MYVPGLLFTLVVDNRIKSLFGPQNRGTHDVLRNVLQKADLGGWKPQVAEKLLRVTHTAAYLAGLLSQSGQKVFWMTDDDSISANPDFHQRTLRLFESVLSVYGNHPYGLVGGAVPFKERNTDTLDLLSAADVVAGSLAHYLTLCDGSEGTSIKDGAYEVVKWLGHDGLALKKMMVLIRQVDEEGNLQTSELRVGPTEVPPDAYAVYVPIIFK